MAFVRLQPLFKGRALAYSLVDNGSVGLRRLQVDVGSAPLTTDGARHSAKILGRDPLQAGKVMHTSQ